MKEDERGESRIHSRMTVLEILDRYPDTVSIFKKYDGKAGICICCEALFEPLIELARKYQLNLDQLIFDLEDSISS